MTMVQQTTFSGGGDNEQPKAAMQLRLFSIGWKKHNK